MNVLATVAAELLNSAAADVAVPNVTVIVDVFVELFDSNGIDLD